MMFWKRKGQPYQKFLPAEEFDGSEDGETDSTQKVLVGNKSLFTKSLSQNKWTLSSYLHWIVHGAFAIMFAIGLWSEGINLVDNSQPAAWSPADIVISNSSIPIQFNGSLFDGRSKYFGPPTPERVRDWELLTNVGNLNISREEMIKMGRTLDSAQYPEEYGGGYIGLPEAAHYIHCIYSLWQDHYYVRDPYIFGSDYKAEEEQLSENIRERHFNHCIDIIRHKLMCNPDPGILTMRWVQGKKAPLPDFNTIHSCSAAADVTKSLAVPNGWVGSETPFEGYEALYRWAESKRVRSAPGDIDYHWVIPENAVVLAESP